MSVIHGLFSHSVPALSALGHASYHFIRGASPENLLLAGRAAFLVFSFVVAAISFTRWRRAAERDSAHTSAQLGALNERLERIERLAAQSDPRLQALREQIEAHFKVTSGNVRENYPIAIRLARSGAEPEELMSNCGLTRQEAELIVRLHGRRTGRAELQPSSLQSRNAA